MTKLATIDASALTAGATISAAATTTATNAAITIKGSLTAANTLTGSSNADTIIGGAKNDTITGGGKGDTLTGNGGNDKFVVATGDSVIGTGTFDTITDFAANTYGQGASGAVTVAGATTDATKINGDTLQIAKTALGTGGVLVSVFSNAADATTYLATNKAANTVVAALDSTTAALYIDNVGADGVADLYIKLTGVTTIDAAAFVLV
jgi:S-layer protein